MQESLFTCIHLWHGTKKWKKRTPFVQNLAGSVSLSHLNVHHKQLHTLLCQPVLDMKLNILRALLIIHQKSNTSRKLEEYKTKNKVKKTSYGQAIFKAIKNKIINYWTRPKCQTNRGTFSFKSMTVPTPLCQFAFHYSNRTTIKFLSPYHDKLMMYLYLWFEGILEKGHVWFTDCSSQCGTS